MRRFAYITAAWLLAGGVLLFTPLPMPATAEQPPPGMITGGIEEEESDEDIEVEVPPEEAEASDQAGQTTDTQPPSASSGGQDSDKTARPSPTNNPPPTETPKESIEQTHDSSQPGPLPAQTIAGVSPPPAIPPPKPPEEPGVALCAPSPLMRADATVGRFWQAGASQVPDLLKQGYTPAIYVEGKGTTCALTDVHVNPSNYALDKSVLYTDGGMACPAEIAVQLCGDSAIHPFYRKK